MTENTVYFEDNTCEDIDVIVYATGYRYECPFLDSSVLTIQENRTRLYKYVFPPYLARPTLGVIGLVQAVGAVMPLSEIQSRWFCKVVKGKFEFLQYDDFRLFSLIWQTDKRKLSS